MRRLVLLFGLLLVAAGCGGDEESAADLPLGRQIAVTADFTPSVHLFAEPVVARIDVVVDREHLDPDRLTLDPRLLPYDVDESSESREDRGRFTHLRYEWVLRCLRVGCIPEILSSAAGENETGRGERRVIRLSPAKVVYDDPDGEKRVVAQARWPEVVSASRIRQSDVPASGFVFQTSATPLPDPDYRVPPAVLGAGLLAAALALLALPAALVAGWMRRRKPVVEVVEEPELTPLERALRLVEWANTRDDGVERREALERLAFELDGLSRGDAARSARGLAWAAPSPAVDATSALVEEVRVAHGRE